MKCISLKSSGSATLAFGDFSVIPILVSPGRKFLCCDSLPNRFSRQKNYCITAAGNFEPPPVPELRLDPVPRTRRIFYAIIVTYFRHLSGVSEERRDGTRGPQIRGWYRLVRFAPSSWRSSDVRTFSYIRTSGGYSAEIIDHRNRGRVGERGGLHINHMIVPFGFDHMIG